MALPLTLALLGAGPAYAQQAQSSGRHHPLVRDPELPRVEIYSESAGPRGSGGFIASVPLAHNATVGFGRFIVQPRKRISMQDQPVTLEPKRNRRAAVGLSLRF